MFIRKVAVLVAWAFTPFIAGAEGYVPDLAKAYLEIKVPQVEIPRGMTLDRAYAAQAEYVRVLERELGPRVGYKAGIVTKAGQERLGLTHPIRGVFLEKMLLPNNSTVSAAYGIRPLLEADLIVTVKDEKINSATTLQEAVDALDEIVTFIELADSTVSTNQPMDGTVVVALNVGARLGVLGTRKKISEIPDFIASCEKMKFVLKDGEMNLLSSVEGSEAGGNPLNALLWLVQDLRKHGQKLRAGDVLSLGSPSPQVIPKAGQKFTLTYEGFPGQPLTCTVAFKP